MLFQPVAISLFFALATGFSPQQPRWNGRIVTKPQPTGVISPAAVIISPTFPQRKQVQCHQQDIKKKDVQEGEDSSSSSLSSKMAFWGQVVLNRLNTLKSAGLEDAKVAGFLPQKIKDAHNPKTYMVLALLAGFKWKWCFRNPIYWFAFGFCIKWYRARYVFKIPVWDRQPNWNNIITSKEQEKDLKAFTCTQCGSTIFIAKTREFFFEGDTGIGGLGCFSCGAKGKENFTMDRDRIVEDVADMDDYFDYERPLDFVSRAERRELLEKTGGDEEAANKLLIETTTGSSSDNKEEDDSIVDADIIDDVESPETTEEETSNSEVKEVSQETDNSEEATETPSLEKSTNSAETPPVEKKEKESTKAKKVKTSPPASKKKDEPQAVVDEPPVTKKPKKKKKKVESPPTKATPKQEAVPDDDLDIFDALGMDDL